MFLTDEITLINNTPKTSLAEASRLLTTEFPITSSISYALFLLTLPAPFIYRNVSGFSLGNDENQECSRDSLWKRYVESAKAQRTRDDDETEEQFNKRLIREFNYYYPECSRTHKFRSSLSQNSSIENLHLTLRNDEKNPKHHLYFAGNAEDSMSVYSAYKMIKRDPTVNYTLWNYPGVGASAGNSSVQSLVAAGVEQVKQLIKDGVKVENITLDGYSLGGAIAIQVAKQLYAEGIFVNLQLDRTFASNSAFVPGHIDSRGLNNPLISTTVTCGALGLSLGIGFAALAKLIGVSLNVVFTAIGMSSLGSALDYSIDKLGSLIGGIIMVAGLISFTVVGACIGTLLSAQYFVADEPWTAPMDFAFKFALKLANCELDSFSAFNDVLNTLNVNQREHEINVITTLDDSIIPYYASLQRAFIGEAFSAEESSAKFLANNDYEEDTDNETECSDLSDEVESGKSSTVFFRQHATGDHGKAISKDEEPEFIHTFRK